ncbi:MAG: hypothetical protein RLZZ142_1470, partial [Verrucomicrobiota bacterium]
MKLEGETKWGAKREAEWEGNPERNPGGG